MKTEKKQIYQNYKIRDAKRELHEAVSKTEQTG